jgi:hypothetical protein
MRRLTLLALACAAALGGGCAIVIAPDSGDLAMRTAWDHDAVQGNGQLRGDHRPIGAPRGLDISGPLAVEVRVGGAPALDVEADDNLLPLIHTEMRGDSLRVWVEGNVRSTNPLRVRVSVPQLADVHAAGSGSLRVDGLTGGDFNLDTSGSRHTLLGGRVDHLKLDKSGSGGVDAARLDIGDAVVHAAGSGHVSLGRLHGAMLRADVTGSGGLEGSGSVQRLDLAVTGSGGASLGSLDSARAELESNGSGGITVRVRDAVVAQANGSGHITIYGNPAERTLKGSNISVVN